MQDWNPSQLESHIEAGDKVFLKLWKKGCGACKLSIPAIERLEADNPHGLIFGQINTDDHPEMLEISETGVLPAFFVFTKSKMAGSLIGFKGLAKLQELVKGSLEGGIG